VSAKFLSEHEEQFWRDVFLASFDNAGATVEMAIHDADRALLEYRERSRE
jgi:hypothetical protein